MAWIRIATTLSLSYQNIITPPQVNNRELFYVNLQGVLVDVHGSIIREVPYNPTHEGPLYTGRLQVIGPGFAPFKPYLRPSNFYFRVSHCHVCAWSIFT